MQRLLGAVIALSFAILIAQNAMAQQAATLIADRVELAQDRTLVAEGNVEILQGTAHVKAQRVTYDGTTDTLKIEGPIVLQDGESTVILASQAELSDGLENGILRGARLVLNQQLQIAAVEMQRVNGRYIQAYKVAATSCHVCETGRPPLWQIRAKRIVHDELEQQLYFDEAQLRVLDIPIFWLPRLRLPDPTLDRASGFLIPKLQSSSLIGWGVKAPYFFKLGDSRDLTVTPWLTNKSTTLELAYRQAFSEGRITWETYISRDDLTAEPIRWGILADGSFDLARNYTLAFDIEAASDASYLSEYDYSNKDRLDSAISLARTRAFDTSFVELVGIRSLRNGEDNGTFPGLILDARHSRNIDPGLLGGDALASLDFHSHYRSSDSQLDADGDGISDGLDVARASAELEWTREWAHRSGLLFGAKATGGIDLYALSNDPTFDSHAARGSAGAAVSVSMPFAKTNAAGVRHMIAPKVQLTWTGQTDANLPNEDSRFVELDSGNLFSFNRAPGRDIIEDGARIDAGLTWMRMAPQGRTSSLTIGRSERLSGTNSFTTTSGLKSDSSDWLLEGALDTGTGLNVVGRILLDNDYGVTKNELRASYEADRWEVSGAFAYLSADVDEDRTTNASELAIAAAYDIRRSFTLSGDLRYDFTTSSTTEAGLGLTYLNECVEVELSVSRNFTSSASVTPSTDFGLTIGLRGFGTSAIKASTPTTCH